MQKQKILFLHGALGAASNFKPLIEKCCETFDCITIDFPGHGEAAMDKEFSIDYFTGFLIDSISKKFDTPVSVFGYSMGGYIALNALTQKPDLFHKIMTLGTKFNWTAEEGKKQMAMLNAEKVSEKIPHYAAYLSQLHTAEAWTTVMQQTCGLIEKLSTNPPLQMTLISTLDNPVCVGIGDHDQMVTLDETLAVYKQCKNGCMYVVPQMLHPIEKINADLMFANMKSFF